MIGQLARTLRLMLVQAVVCLGMLLLAASALWCVFKFFSYVVLGYISILCLCGLYSWAESAWKASK